MHRGLMAALQGLDQAVAVLKQKDAVNQAFKEFFGNRPPTRNLVEVSDIGEETIVEIALTAIAH